MKIFIIGGTKKVGPSLVGELVSAGHRIACFNRRGTCPGIGEAIKGDRNDDRSLKKGIFDFGPDLVIDMIPYTEEQARRTARLIRESKSALIACSSIDVYRAYNILHRMDSPPYQRCPLHESDELRAGLTNQGKAYDKLNVEKVYLSLESDVTLFRLPAIYGWPDTTRIKEFVDPMVKGVDIKMNPDRAKFRMSYSLNKNCAYAISLGVNCSGRNIYNVAEPVHHTQEEWCRKTGGFAGWEGSVVYDESIQTEIDWNQQWFVSSELIREELGFYEKYDCDAGLGEAVEKYVSSEPIA